MTWILATDWLPDVGVPVLIQRKDRIYMATLEDSFGTMKYLHWRTSSTRYWLRSDVTVWQSLPDLYISESANTKVML